MKKTTFTLAFLGAIMSYGQTIDVRQAGSVLTTTKGGNNSVISGIGAGNAMIANANNATASESVFIGALAGMNTTGVSNTFVGWGAGPANTTGEYNTFLGRSAGDKNTTSFYNTFIGALSGLKNTTGPGNTFVGFGAGRNNVGGGNNVITGWGAGALLNSWGNTIYGRSAGASAIGDANVLIGQSAGSVAVSGNVMIGSSAGETAAVSNQLFIDNTNTSSPLIWGDFAQDQLKLNGKVGIGNVTSFPTNPLYANYKLFVTGGILSDEVRVALSSGGTWADYVFKKDYQLKSIPELEAFITENGHLPNVPKGSVVEADGINVAEMAKIQMEKIEELTLYIIELHKKMAALEAKIDGKK